MSSHCIYLGLDFPRKTDFQGADSGTLVNTPAGYRRFSHTLCTHLVLRIHRLCHRALVTAPTRGIALSVVNPRQVRDFNGWPPGQDRSDRCPVALRFRASGPAQGGSGAEAPPRWFPGIAVARQQAVLERRHSARPDQRPAQRRSHCLLQRARCIAQLTRHIAKLERPPSPPLYQEESLAAQAARLAQVQGSASSPPPPLWPLSRTGHPPGPGRLLLGVAFQPRQRPTCGQLHRRRPLPLALRHLMAALSAVRSIPFSALTTSVARLQSGRKGQAHRRRVQALPPQHLFKNPNCAAFLCREVCFGFAFRMTIGS